MVAFNHRDGGVFTALLTAVCSRATPAPRSAAMSDALLDERRLACHWLAFITVAGRVRANTRKTSSGLIPSLVVRPV